MADLSKNYNLALFWTKMSIVGPALIPFFLLWFSIVFPSDKKISKLKLFFAFIPSLLIIILSPTKLNVLDIKIEPWGTEFTPGPLYWAMAILLAVYISWSFVNTIKNYKKSSGIERYQIKYLFIGFLISLILGILLNLILPTLGYSRASSIGPSMALFFIGFTGYAITRYRLMDIRIIIKKIFIHLLVSIFVYGLFYLIAWIYLKSFGGIFNNTSYIAGIFLAIGFVTIFSWLRTLLKNVSDKYFFKNLTNYHNSLIFLSQELNKYNDLDKIISLIVDTIKPAMNLDRAGVLLVNINSKPIHYQIAKTIGFNEQNGISLVQDNFLTQYLQKTKSILLLDELSLLSRNAKTKKDSKGFSDLKRYMEHIEASLCLPLISNNNLIGIVVLGAKLSKDAYTKEDLELLSALGSQASIAIENARLYDEINDKKRELDKFNRELKYKVEEQTKDIKEKNRHLEELLNMKSDFLRTVNHQLNTPLSIMKNAFSMIEDKSLEVNRGLEIASIGLERMSNTISDFWDAFELEGQKIEMALIETNIEKIINDMIKEKKNLKLVKTRNLKINLTKPSFKIPKVLCDQKKITHVISNLLDNAVFYTEKGSINIGFEKINKNGKKFLKILVSDTGCGVSEEDREKLFSKFSRGSTASSIHPDGSGLGLYIAKNIVEDSGGELKLEDSKIGEGATFSFALQISNLKSTNQKSVSNTKPVIKNTKINNCSILFIEDEQSIVDLYKIYFEKHGYNFYSTHDLSEAEDMLKTKNIDVVILDIIIRKKEKDGMINVVAEQGYTFLEKIKKEKLLKNIPVIMFSNLNTEQDRVKAKNLGASDYLFKGSAKPQDLINAINKAIHYNKKYLKK